MKNQRQIGGEYEQIAGRYLESCGYQILEYNFRCHYGEVDIIAKHGEYVVFVEVKYRSSNKYGMPLEAITRRKQQTISKCAQVYLYRKHLGDAAVRFDVVGILGDEIEVIQNAFSFAG